MLIGHVFRYLIAKMAPKNSQREIPLIDNSRAIKRRNGDVVSKFLWRSRESIAEIRLNGDRPLEALHSERMTLKSKIGYVVRPLGKIVHQNCPRLSRASYMIGVGVTGGTGTHEKFLNHAVRFEENANLQYQKILCFV